MSNRRKSSMRRLADAHVHLFAGGYGGARAMARRPGVHIDETKLYASLAAEHGIEQALVVGYEGERWARGNNQHIRRLATQNTWVKPLAYVRPQDARHPRRIDALIREPFVGVAFYVFDDAAEEAVAGIPDDFWDRLVSTRRLVSVNSRGDRWNVWQKVLDRHPALRLLISHLGLPEPMKSPGRRDRRSVMKSVLNLAKHPSVYIKLSGMYALTRVGHDYPHRAASPYVDLALQHFGPRRMLWGSDFSPCLGWISFPQAADVSSLVPSAALTAIAFENLDQLLSEVVDNFQ